MHTKEKLLEMLSSKKASERYEACERLRASKESSPEIVTALEKATHDEDKDIAERAKLALQADVHHQMTMIMGMSEPDNKEAVDKLTSTSSAPNKPDHALPRSAAIWFLCLGLVLIAIFVVIERMHQRNRLASWELPLQSSELVSCSCGDDQILIDSKDRIWIYPDIGRRSSGCISGCEPDPTTMCMYDGKTWNVFTPSISGLPEEVPNILGEDTEGRIYIEAGGEVAYFQNDNFSHYFNINDINNLNPDTRIFYSVNQAGNLWITYEWCYALKNCHPAISLYNGISIITYDYHHTDLPKVGYFHSLQFDQAGRTWVFTLDTISYFDDAAWTTFQLQLPDYLVSEDFHYLTFTVADSGEVWVNNIKAIALFDNGHWKAIPQIQNLSFPKVLLDFNNLPWVASGDGQVFHFDGEAWELRVDHLNRHNQYNYIYNLQLDSKGRLWVIYNIGTVVVDDTSFYMLSPDNSIVGWHVNDIALDKDNRVWLATDTGIVVSVSEFVKPYSPPQWLLSIRNYLVDGYRWLFPSFLILISLAIYFHLGKGIQLAIGLGMILGLFTHLIFGGVGAFTGILGAVVGRRTRGRDHSIIGAAVGVAIIIILLCICYYIGSLIH